MNGIHLFNEYGFAGLVVATLFFIVWRMLVWVMAFIKDITKQQNEERVNWLSTLEKHIALIDKMANSIDEIERRADERGKFVKEEHKEIIEILRRINGK